MNNALIVRRAAGKGRGVFAGRNFRKGEIIEVCPVIPMKAREANACGDTILDDYFFEWGPKGNDYAILMGYGGLYNNSDDPNATYDGRLKRLEMVFRALRDIKKGEEILINYNWPSQGKKMPPPRLAI
ncbi:MAG: SET domain-containing protein [Gemmataceae bacterium]